MPLLAELGNSLDTGLQRCRAYGAAGTSQRLRYTAFAAQSCAACPILSRFQQMKHFKAVAAMSLNRVIGQGNKIPWHLPDDFKWFKKLTTGHTLVMGRKTFESIGRPLPNRTTIVLSRSGFRNPEVRTVNSLDQINPALEPSEVFICGGADVYQQALPLCSDLYLTLVKRTVEGDAFFPRFEDRFEAVEHIADNVEFSITRYRNKSLSASWDFREPV
jgi:dihydrofolate reductase